MRYNSATEKWHNEPLPSDTKTNPYILNVLDYGATGNKTVDDAAFLAALTEAKNSTRPVNFTIQGQYTGEYMGRCTIYIPAGDYVIKNPRGLFGAENFSQLKWS